MKSVIKEVISMLFIALAILIILVLLFYDYLKADSVVDASTEYELSEAAQSALEDESEYNQVISTYTKSMYSLSSADVYNYVTEGVISKGKQHPFSDITDESYATGGVVENATTTDGTTYSTGTTYTTSGTTGTSTTATTDASTSGTNSSTSSTTSGSSSTSSTSSSSSSSSTSSTSSTSSSSSSSSSSTTSAKASSSSNNSTTTAFFDDGTSK